MKKHSKISLLAIVAAALSVAACAKNAPPAEDAGTAEEAVAEEPVEAAPLAPVKENTSSNYVEGVAGGVMVTTVQLQAEVVSVDQEKREAVLRGPEGNEVVVRVGKEAVNFYQVKAGDRVNVTMARELVVYVPDEAEENPDGVAAGVAQAEKGDTPGGAVVATAQITGKISALDAEKRVATLTFEEGKEEQFSVREDVDMSKYEVGQEVVFLITELLALEVEAI